MSNRLLRGIGVGAALSALWLGIVAGPASAAGSVRWVDDGGSGGPHACASATYTTIQAAIDASPAWGTVKVCPGTYAEQLVVNKKGVTVESARLHAAHIVAPASLETFDGEDSLVTLNGWADKLIGFDIGIASGDLPSTSASTSGVVAQDGTCAHVDTAVWSLNGRQTIRRNVIHPNGPYSLSGECGYDYGIVFGVSEPVATTQSGTILTGSEVSRAANNKITDFRFGGILAEGSNVKVHIDHNRVTFLHTNDPDCSFPINGAPTAKPAACVFGAPDKVAASAGKGLFAHTSSSVGATPSQVNSAFFETFGIGAEGGAAVDVDYNNVHSGLEADISNSILAAGIWLIDADGTSRVFNDIVTNTWIGIATGTGDTPVSNPVAKPAAATDGVEIWKNTSENNWLGIGIDSDATNLYANVSTANFFEGIEVLPGNSSSLIHGNNFAFNYNESNGLGDAYDCDDQTVGTGTDGTNNTWTNNLGLTSNPDALCTEPSAP